MNVYKWALAFAAASVLTIASASAATVSIRLSTDGSTWTTITDGGASDNNTNAGAVGYNDSDFGGFNVTLLLGNLIENPTSVSLSTLSLTVNGTGTLYVQTTATGLALPTGPHNLTFDINGASLGQSIDSASFYDNGNGAFSTASQIGSDLDFVSGAAFDAGGGTSATASLTTPFSLTQTFEIVHLPGDLTQFDAHTVAAVPVPLAAPLFLTGLGGLGLAALRRRRRSPEEKAAA